MLRYRTATLLHIFKDVWAGCAGWHGPWSLCLRGRKVTLQAESDYCGVRSVRCEVGPGKVGTRLEVCIRSHVLSQR